MLNRIPIARLQCLTHDELRYTPISVDPKEVHGEDFPGEAFRVLKEKEIKQFVEFNLNKTCRLNVAGKAESTQSIRPR